MSSSKPACAVFASKIKDMPKPSAGDSDPRPHPLTSAKNKRQNTENQPREGGADFWIQERAGGQEGCTSSV